MGNMQTRKQQTRKQPTCGIRTVGKGRKLIAEWNCRSVENNFAFLCLYPSDSGAGGQVTISLFLLITPVSVDILQSTIAYFYCSTETLSLLVVNPQKVPGRGI